MPNFFHPLSLTLSCTLSSLSSLPLPPPSTGRCLSSCCYSATAQPGTCSREGYIMSSGGFAPSCPAPPRIQFPQNGPLDKLTYVSEHLLRVGEVNPDAYGNEYHFGFTIEDRPFFPLQVCRNLPNPNFFQNFSSLLISSSSLWKQLSALCINDTESRLAQHDVAPWPGQQPPGVTVWYSNEVCVCTISLIA